MEAAGGRKAASRLCTGVWAWDAEFSTLMETYGILYIYGETPVLKTIMVVEMGVSRPSSYCCIACIT